MKIKREIPIPEKKIKSVKELSDSIENKKTILIASIKNIPASQFQEIGKKLRGKAIVKVPKKNLIFRALDSSKNEAIKKLREQIKDNVAILFSDMDCFDLAAELIKNKTPARAKAGQEAPEDIEVQAGPTDLVPGPAISELGALGIQIQIEKGKINIKEPKIIAKKNEKISANAADIMSKLGIKPFSIGFIPLSAFDTQEGKLYLNIEIDKEKTIEELKSAFCKASAFASEICYVCKDTIKSLISKAGMYENALNKITEEVPEKIEEKKDEKPKEKKEEQNTQTPKENKLEGEEK
jgi:large subunit ribosomal protein L10